VELTAVRPRLTAKRCWLALGPATLITRDGKRRRFRDAQSLEELIAKRYVLWISTRRAQRVGKALGL